AVIDVVNEQTSMGPAVRLDEGVDANDLAGQRPLDFAKRIDAGHEIALTEADTGHQETEGGRAETSQATEHRGALFVHDVTPSGRSIIVETPDKRKSIILISGIQPIARFDGSPT